MTAPAKVRATREPFGGIEDPADPRPPRCPNHGRVRTAGCEPCRADRAWYARRRRAVEEAGGKTSGLVPAGPATDHLIELLAFYSSIEVAALAGIARASVNDIRAGTRRNIYRELADAILSVPIPTNIPRRIPVPAFAVRRRIHAFSCAGWTRVDQAQMLGWDDSTLSWWTATDLVDPAAHDAVVALANRLRGKTGPNAIAQAKAVTAGWLPFEAWPGDTIDDPGYDPRSPDPEPFRSRRRLRALACAGFGAAWVTDQLRTKVRLRVADVRAWTRHEQPIPRFMKPLLDPLYERHAKYVGPSQPDADYARVQGWASAADWDEFGIDGPTRPGARPRDPAAADPVMMHAAAAGGLTAIQLTAPERSAVVHYLTQLRWTPAAIGDLLKWAPTRTAAERAVMAVLNGPRDNDNITQIRRLAAELAAQQREVRGTPA